MKDLQIRQLEAALNEQFDGLIDMTDLEGRDDKTVRPAFLSRALAALAVLEVTGLDREQAAACVIDGFDDQGIDAVAVDADAPHIYIIQAKWSKTADASFDQKALFALKEGLKKLVSGQYDRFNNKLQPMVPALNYALSNPRVQITIVPALAGDRGLPPAQQDFEDLKDEYNDPQEILRVEPLLLQHFISALRAGLDDPRVDLKARMPDFRFHGEPYLAYYGTLTADQVAGWYAEHRHRLFQRNIRFPLGLTKINSGLVETVLREPTHFWYFHNGITVLCDQLDVGPRGDLELSGASVVNGAQTVSSLHEAAERSAESVARARVHVRIIPLKGTPDNFDRQVTIATNTQNGVAEQDFRALDDIQTRLRYDFDVTLNKTYVIKRGETPPAPADGCDMVEAAIALGCAHQDPQISFQAKSEASLLWKDEIYTKIFRRPDARRVWRAVQLLRAVRKALVPLQQSLESRAGAFVDQGEYMITHLVFRQQQNWSSCPEGEWTRMLKLIPASVEAALRWAMYALDRGNTQVGGVFRTAQRYAHIAESAAEGLLSRESTPELSPEYQSAEREKRARQANAVTVIVDAGAIAEGTRLEFRPVTDLERRALTKWIAEDRRRGSATWVVSRSNRSKVLLWEWNGERYSPSALVVEMFRHANKSGPQAVQGTRRWFVAGQGSLVDIANSIRGDSAE
ncbi:AIPR family protein [Streptomyces sp. Ag109_O5-10]|uniref:AIPR family protein n=1 Tax=Streptomyces sp. Ag109_O5-10 TaxID=1855349 RepID=UPI000894453A|nr:AIPR family protein [Streptomyces sp. Ag109_O5-10]SEE57335.1 AIPR protein [Streptomyces sp. Ag109_O5-10]